MLKKIEVFYLNQITHYDLFLSFLIHINFIKIFFLIVDNF
jgi:hypothetical protein